MDVVAPVCVSAPDKRGAPGANSASAESANTEKIAATESCFDMIWTRLCCSAANSRTGPFGNGVWQARDKKPAGRAPAVPALRASAYNGAMLSSGLNA